MHMHDRSGTVASRKFGSIERGESRLVYRSCTSTHHAPRSTQGVLHRPYCPPRRSLARAFTFTFGCAGARACGDSFNSDLSLRMVVVPWASRSGITRRYVLHSRRPTFALKSTFVRDPLSPCYPIPNPYSHTQHNRERRIRAWASAQFNRSRLPAHLVLCYCRRFSYFKDLNLNRYYY